MRKVELAQRILAEKNLSSLEINISYIRGWENAIVYADFLGLSPAFFKTINNAVTIQMLAKFEQWAFPNEVTEKVLSHPLIIKEVQNSDKSVLDCNLLYAEMILINHSQAFDNITSQYLKEQPWVSDVILSCARFEIYTWLDTFFIPGSLLISNLYHLLKSGISEDEFKEALSNYPLVEALKRYFIQTISAFNAYSILCFYDVVVEKQLTTDDETLILAAYYYRQLDESYQQNNKAVLQKIVNEPDFVQRLLSCEAAQKNAVFAAVRFNRTVEDIEFCMTYKGQELAQMLFWSNDEKAAAYSIGLNKEIHKMAAKMKYFGEQHDSAAGSACLRVIMNLNGVINKYFGEGSELQLLHDDPIPYFKQGILDVLDAETEKEILDAHRGIMGYVDSLVTFPQAWVSPETKEAYWGSGHTFFQTNTSQILADIKKLTNELTGLEEPKEPPSPAL